MNTTSPNNYEPMLRESIDHFLSEFLRGGSDFSAFESIFFRLIQTMTDPPLEITWFYSAVTFHSSKPSFHDYSKKILIVKDLFQLLVSCSVPSSGLKRIAVLAPVLYHLYNTLVACGVSKPGFVLRREIDVLVEGVFSYVSLCGGNDCFGEQENGLELDTRVPFFTDLIRVWTVDRIGDNCEHEADFRLFFPLLSEDVQNVECGMGYLAGVVMTEALLLKLCLKFGSEVSREVLQKDVLDCVVRMIMGFRNSYFLDILLRMLLEPSLPVTTLLRSEDEVIVRLAIYDVVLLGEYSFLDSSRLSQLHSNHLKNLALVWLFVTDNAIQFVRGHGEHAKVISYVEAFSASHLPNRLIKWVTNQTSVDGELRRPNISTPKALIKWLLVLENQGVRIFDQNVSKLYDKALVCKSRLENELPSFKDQSKNCHETSLFTTANEGRRDGKGNGDEEMVDMWKEGISDSVPTSNLRERDGGRKRKEGIKNEVLTRIKIAKYYNAHDNSLGEKFLPSTDDGCLSAGSQVQKAGSDEDMEEVDC